MNQLHPQPDSLSSKRIDGLLFRGAPCPDRNGWPTSPEYAVGHGVNKSWDTPPVRARRQATGPAFARPDPKQIDTEVLFDITGSSVSISKQ